MTNLHFSTVSGPQAARVTWPIGPTITTIRPGLRRPLSVYVLVAAMAIVVGLFAGFVASGYTIWLLMAAIRWPALTLTGVGVAAGLAAFLVTWRWLIRL